MTPRLEQAVAEAQRRLEARSERYLAGKNLRPSCRRGCAFCCLAWVVVGLAEAEYLRAWLEAHRPERLKALEAEGARRLRRIARRKHQPGLATAHFLKAQPCPLLTPQGACAAYAARPLACRGVLTDLPARYCAPGVVPALRGRERALYQSQLRPWHGPEHYLKVPWQLSQRAARRLWAIEQRVRGFTVVGELASMVHLLGVKAFRSALEEGLPAARRWLEGRGLLGGAWGFWIG